MCIRDRFKGSKSQNQTERFHPVSYTHLDVYKRQVYKPGNVKLTPKILDNSQKYVQEKFGTGEEPINFVFHGGSGSSLEEIREAIDYGVIKMNIDTDLQFAYTEGIRDYMVNNIEFLKSQIGNPDGDDKPNKKYYDPRVWVRKGEETFGARLVLSLIHI